MARSEGGEFSVLDRKLFNVLLAKAYPAIEQVTTHRIPLKDLLDLFGHARPDRIKESLERLWGHKIAIDYIGDDTVPYTVRCHYLSFKMSHVGDGFLEYAFDPILMNFIGSPKVFSIIQINTMRKFTSSHALKLYEQMRMYYGRHSPVYACSLDEAYSFFEIGEDDVYRSRFDRFRERVIETSISEVNALAEFTVAVEYQRSGRGNKVVGFRFRVTGKSAESLIETADHVHAPGRRRRLDGQTLDMFKGVSDDEFYTEPTLRQETMEEAARIVGMDGNVQDLMHTWLTEQATKGYGARPDEVFLAWLKLRQAKRVDPVVRELDVDAILTSLIGEG